MFCTKLRRRPSFAPVVPRLIAQHGLDVRESLLETHDISIPLQTHMRQRTGHANTVRELRLLLFSISAVSDRSIPDTITRIERFASQAQTQDLAIILLMNPPLDSSFSSVKVLVANDGICHEAAQAAGMSAFQKLQSSISGDAVMTRIPILPVNSLDCLPSVVKTYVDSLKERPMSQQSGHRVSSFDMLKQCITTPPMSDQTAYILSDLFATIAGLEKFCGTVGRMAVPHISLPCVRAAEAVPVMQAELVSQMSPGASDARSLQRDAVAEKLLQLRTLIGSEECLNVLDFWAEEWVI